MARIFTREELYELVWSKPMTHIAKELAISDVALHKVCRKHAIPNPPLGWWAKKAAGKKVTQTPLPKAKADAAEEIRIAGANADCQSSAVAIAREQTQIRMSEPVSKDAGPPHPMVDRTLAKLRKAKPSEIGLVAVGDATVIKCEVAPQSIDRLATALPLIVQAATQQGFKLAAGKDAVYFESETETIGFAISEIVKRETHVLTETERAKEERWQRKRDQTLGSRNYNRYVSMSFDRPRFPEWDYHPSGQLSFELEQVYIYGGPGHRRAFRDGKMQRLENIAGDIAVGLAVLAAARTEQRLKREAEERRYQEECRRRELAARTRRVEARRTAALRAIASDLEQLARIRQLMKSLTAGLASDTPRVSTFLAWAKEYLSKREGRLSARSIEERFASRHLFGDDDYVDCSDDDEDDENDQTVSSEDWL